MSIKQETTEYIKCATALAKIRSTQKIDMYSGVVGGPLHRAIIDSIQHYFECGDFGFVARILLLMPLEIRTAVLHFVVSHTDLVWHPTKTLVKTSQAIDKETLIKKIAATPLFPSQTNSVSTQARPKRRFLEKSLVQIERDLNAGAIECESEQLTKAFAAFMGKARSIIQKHKYTNCDFWLDDQEQSESVRTISGGLPSLGKRSK